MMAKLKTGESDVVPPVVKKVTSNDPAATAVTTTTYLLVVLDLQQMFTTSVAATAEFVTVNDAAVALPAAANSVIAPQAVLSVTPVVLDVICVTAPPAPVAKPRGPVDAARDRIATCAPVTFTSAEDCTP